MGAQQRRNTLPIVTSKLIIKFVDAFRSNASTNPSTILSTFSESRKLHNK